MSSLTAAAAPSTGRAIAYWVTTVLVAANLAVGGVWDVLQTSYVRGVIEHLGYPDYILLIMGVWKLPGAVVVLMPRFPRLKEWAYAGAIFVYTGAVASHLASGDDIGALAPPLILTCLTVASWALRPAARRDLGAG